MSARVGASAQPGSGLVRVDEATFFAAPTGRYLAAPGIAYWCARESLWGISAWDVLDDAFVRNLTRWIDREYERAYPPYASVVDLRRVTRMEPEAFAAFGDFYARSRARQATRVQSVALVRPGSGLAAPLVAGLAPVLEVGVPWRVVASLEEGIAWQRIEGAAQLAAVIDAMCESAARGDGPLESLRRLLVAPFAVATPADAAARMGVSLRTLQRNLKAEGTSFEAELRTARVRHAQRLLTETDTKLGAVALEAGFATQAHFNTVFRKETGESPGRWRELHAIDAKKPRDE